MNQLGVIFCSVAILACGTGRQAEHVIEPTTEAPPKTADHISVAAEVRSIALYRANDSGEPMLLLSAENELLWFGASGQPATTKQIDLPTPHIIDIRAEHLWVASVNQATRFTPDGEADHAKVQLGPDANISAIEIGFNNTKFLADAKANRIYAGSEVLVEGESLGNPSALLLNGGNLIIGNQAGVLSYNIKTGEQKPLSGATGKVVGLALDHLGYLVVGTANGEIHQLHMDGSIKLLHTMDGPLSSIAFDDRERMLYAASGTAVHKLDYLDLTKEDKELWKRRDARPMRAFSRNGMTLEGAEYWPSHGTTNVSYPEDILWGFYPSPNQVFEGSAAALAPPPAALACAEKSFAALQTFFDTNPAAFHDAAEATGASKRFYLWVNDYSDADESFPHELRMNRFWYWERKPAVTGRVHGFWKWETTLLQDGTCLWPQPEQIADELASKLVPSK